MSELDEVVNEIGRSYTKQRIALNEMWKFEFDTPHKRKIMNEQISELDKQYRQQIREKKIEHILK
jgi:hypothetical protein